MKVRFYSFLFFIIMLFIFLTSIPGRLWQQSAEFVPSEEKTLELDVELSESPYRVEVDRTPIFSFHTPNEEIYSTESDVPSERSVLEDTSAVYSTPAQTTTSITPKTMENSFSPKNSDSSMNNPGSYPESHFLDGNSHDYSENGETDTVPANGLSSPDALPQSNGEALPQDAPSSNPEHELTSSVSAQIEEFLNESPMIQKDQKTTNRFPFLKVSRRDGFDLIPEHSGINGRSIYGPREHFIEDGDTLPKLASRYLGNSNRENEIFEMNQDILSDKEILPIGQKLLIPEKY